MNNDTEFLSLDMNRVRSLMAKYSQINPTASNQDTSQDYSNNTRITALIKEQLKSGISIDAFVNKYSQTDDKTNTTKRKYIFRGQTFATSDPSSSYATPTWRTGRTGIVYGTPYAHTGVTYATNLSSNSGANGQTMNAEHMLKIDDNPVWREILDYMAPNMRTTHIHGMQGNNRDKITQEIHGRQFLERLNALNTQQTAQGAVTTYDLPIEILEKMGYKTPGKQANNLAQMQFQQSINHTME